MKSSYIDQAHSTKLLTVKLTRLEFDDFFGRAVKKLGRRVKVDGFREGRAPDAVVIEKVGMESVTGEALDMALSDTYILALKEHDLNPIAYPEINIKKMVEARDGLPADEIVVEYEATVTVLPDVTVKDLEGIKATRPVVAAVEDSEIETVLKQVFKQKAILKDAEVDRVAAKGDWCVISYDGIIGGVPKEGMKNESHPLILGEGNLIPGFEENVEGMKAGDEKSFDIEFPKDYGQKDFAGQKARFTIKLKELKEVVMPEFDAVFSKDFGFDTPEKMRKAISDNLMEEKKKEAEEKLQSDILEQLEKRIEVDLPEKLIAQEVDGMVTDLKERVEKQGMKWDQYLGSLQRSEDDLRKDMRPQAERNVKLGLSLGWIVREEKLEIKDQRQAAALALEWLISKATGEPMRPVKSPKHDHHDHKH